MPDPRSKGLMRSLLIMVMALGATGSLMAIVDAPWYDPVPGLGLAVFAIGLFLYKEGGR